MIVGTVLLTGLRCGGRHGNADADGPAQLFLADVSIEVDLESVAVSDSYADVVDLSALAATVREVVGGPPKQLLETVAVLVARRVLEEYPLVRRVRLRLARPDPPGLDADQEAVEVALERAGTG
jgi:7,8-dihydroneopterin aldolase/epimerase/oxygenase